nr:hypothetical protein [Tanacetum cinerariifolium]
ENVIKDVTNDAIPSPPSHDFPSPPQEQSSPPQQPQSLPQAPPQGAQFPTRIQQVLDVCSALTRRVENLKHDKAAQKLEIIKLKARVKRLEKTNKVKSLKLRRLRKVEASKRVESSDDMEDYIKRYQGMKKRPRTESKARKNMMIYLKNTAGYKMDLFKGMSYAKIYPIFQARFDENMRKLSEKAQEAEDLKKRLEVVDDEDDDVFIEATPLARKVHKTTASGISKDDG